MSETCETRAVRLLHEAFARGTLSLHFEPCRDGRLRVRERTATGLREATTFSPVERAAVVSRLKHLGGLDPAERRLPQEGTVHLRCSGDGPPVEARVSTLPTTHGEAAVVQSLRPVEPARDLAALGLDPSDRLRLEAALERGGGLVLVAGPGGSGKWTLLRACLRRLAAVDRRSIISIDGMRRAPAAIEGIVDLVADHEVGLHPGMLVRNVLRNDLADGLCVGLLHDLEMARAVVEAAAMGRLVLAALPARDAPSAVQRLLDLGVEPWLVTGALSVIVGCRALRRLCDACKVVGPLVSVDDARGFAPRLVEEEVLTEPFATFLPRAHGCERCQGLGHVGRALVHEVVDRPADLVDALVRAGAPFAALHDRARTLREVALLRASAGEVTLVEALRC